MFLQNIPPRGSRIIIKGVGHNIAYANTCQNWHMFLACHPPDMWKRMMFHWPATWNMPSSLETGWQTHQQENHLTPTWVDEQITIFFWQTHMPNLNISNTQALSPNRNGWSLCNPDEHLWPTTTRQRKYWSHWPKPEMIWVKILNVAWNNLSELTQNVYSYASQIICIYKV